MSTKVGITAENYQVSENIERSRSDAVTGLNKQQEQSDGLKIHGLALPFDKRSRNGVVYQKESIQEAADTLVGCSLLFNHDEDNPIGHIEDVEVKEDGLYYYGDLNEEKREVESLKRGDIPHVSIQATINETEETEKKGIVAVNEFLEMSAVTIPGFSRTDVEAEETVRIEKLFDDNAESIEEKTGEEQEVKEIKEAFEFSPIPTHVLYESKEDAMLRAKRLGLQDVHRHELANEGEFWMAGATHEEWMQAIQDDIEAYDDEDNDEEEEESTSKEPFADYDDFDDCVSQNQDKNDPEAYCAAIKRKVEQSKDLKEAISDVNTEPTEEMAEIASTVLEKIKDPELDNDECGTRVGLERANQLENQEELSADTIGRMVSFFSRHDGNQSINDDVDNKWEDCGYVAWQLWGGDPGREWAERKQEQIEDAKEQILSGEKSNMTEQKDEELSEQVKEQLEQVAEDDFMGTVADMYEELSASDAASLLDEFEFTGNAEPLVALLADAAGMTPADLMELIENGMEAGDMDDEEDDEEQMDDEEDDEEEESGASNKNESSQEESQSGNNSMSKSREELKEKVDQQEEKIQELEKMIEKLEDTEESKQEAATGSSAENSDSIDLNPEFEKKMNGGF